MNTRIYFTGLPLAFLLFGLACALVTVPVMLVRGQTGRPSQFVVVWIMFGLANLIGLALLVGPAILGLMRIVRGRIPVAAAAAAGALLSPLLLVGCFLLFRESNEGLPGLLAFWTRLPGEFLVGLAPHLIASAFFAGWLAAKWQDNL